MKIREIDQLNEIKKNQMKELKLKTTLLSNVRRENIMLNVKSKQNLEKI